MRPTCTACSTCRRSTTSYWTLGVEVQFYIVFALLMLLADALGPSLGRLRARVLVFGATSVVALLWPLGWLAHPSWPGGFAPFWFSFAAGVLVCWGWQHGGSGRDRRARTSLAIGVARSRRLGLRADRALTARRCSPPADSADAAWLGWRWLQFLGAISYSLYLLHTR